MNDLQFEKPGKISYVERNRAQQLITREWLYDFSSLERLALLFVFDRTYAWGKRMEVITLDQCVNGVVDADGKRVCFPWASKAERAAKVLNGLVALGFLLEEKHGKQCRKFGLNLEWKEKTAEQLETMTEPRRKPRAETGLEAPANLPQKRETTSPKSGEQPPTKTGDKENYVEKKESFAEIKHGAPEGRTVVEDVEKGREKSREAIDRTVKKGYYLRKNKTGWIPSFSALSAEWHRRCREQFPNESFTTLSVQTSKNLHRYALRWTEGRDSGEFLDYMFWIIDNWYKVHGIHIFWAKGFPSAPCAAKFALDGMHPCFEQAYRDGPAMLARESKMTPAQRKKRKLVEEKGVDPEYADQIVKDHEDVSKEKAELVKAWKKVGMREEAARRREFSPGFWASQPKKKPIGPVDMSCWNEDIP